VPRPIVAVAHDRRVADQLTLEWGVYPTLAGVAETVDEMIDAALSVARDAAGLPTGAVVVITAGRRTGTPGATNLIMVREIP
jgi:pyruvate kinase